MAAAGGTEREGGRRKLLWILLASAGCGGLLILVVVLAAVFWLPQVVESLGAVQQGHAKAELTLVRERLERHARTSAGKYPASLLSSLGADGLPGGAGDDLDLRVAGPEGGTD